MKPKNKKTVLYERIVSKLPTNDKNFNYHGALDPAYRNIFGEWAVPVGGLRKIGTTNFAVFTKAQAKAWAEKASLYPGFENATVIKITGRWAVAFGDKKLIPLITEKFAKGEHAWLGRHFGFGNEAILWHNENLSSYEDCNIKERKRLARQRAWLRTH